MSTPADVTLKMIYAKTCADGPLPPGDRRIFIKLLKQIRTLPEVKR